MTEKRFNRIVLTGAAGRLGRVLREPLRTLATTVVLTDIKELETPTVAGEEFVICDLADHAGVGRLLEGADLVIHFGGISQEDEFAPILQSNIIGQFNIYDNALTCGIKRIVLASSNHVTGYYPADEVIDAKQPMRPDGLYGLSKCYGEMLASFFNDRHGLESVCLRIGACMPGPNTLRSLAIWLSHADLIELVRCSAMTPGVGFSVVYGVSNNKKSWWSNDDAERIGYYPRDSADDYTEEILRRSQNEIWRPWQGGNVPTRDYRKPETLVFTPPEAITPNPDRQS
ncbi:MAG: NAD-dependent dehydratase [Rhodocyclales bacterium]|nr:NAD-dependent dehydratase [Rhodocyclales bacterium]